MLTAEEDGEGLKRDADERSTAHPDRLNAWEAALRVRSALIAQQLTELAMAERELLLGPMKVDVRHAADVSAFVHRAVGRANAEYVTERRRRIGLDEHEELRAIVDAEAAINAIGREPAVVSFLVAGANVDAERYRMACKTLVALLDVSAEVMSAAAGVVPSLEGRQE